MTFLFTQPTNNDKKQLPTGIQTFSQIREGNYYYVDKTQYLLEIAKDSAFYAPITANTIPFKGA